MGVFDGLRSLLRPEPTPLETRELSADTIAALVARLRSPNTSPWIPATVATALGVPAVFKAVTLISNTIGTLSMEAYRNEVKMGMEDTPRLVIRPDPFKTPFDHWRDSAYYKAITGECWWWIAKRDGDGLPLSVIAVDPRQILVEPNPKNLLRPIITWLDVEMPNDDMVLMKYQPDPNNPLRGWGPLQACGAAVSVAVEAQEWAANFFAGSPANTIIKSAVQVTASEAAILKASWMAGASNLPKVIDPGIESVEEIGTDPDKAQLSDSRLHQNGEVALMFSMPPTLLNYAVQGSTITYQNVGQVADDLTRQCLIPNYLEAFEQSMTDLLSRSTTGRFNLKELLRPDVKTRFDVYNLGIPLGVITPEEARSAEGYAPGDIETRPIPFASPMAIPASLPIQNREEEGREVRCPSPTCGKLYVERAYGRVIGKCFRCRTPIDDSPVETRTQSNELLAAIISIAERPIHVESPVTIADGAFKVVLAAPQPAPEPNVIEVTREDGSKLRLVASNE